MNRYKIIPSLLLVTALGFSSCKDDKDDPVPVDPGVMPMLSIELDHKAGSQKFYLDSTYTSPGGDEFTASMFKYYISNIRLVRTDNIEYLVPDSYYIVNMDSAVSHTLVMHSLPPGMYKSIKFLIGVDSTRNVSGSQQGALDPDKGMHWDWITGYIFMKLEGTSPAIPTSGQNFTWHVGGFTGANNTLREVTLSFNGDILPLAFNKHPELHIINNVLEIFDTPSMLDMSTFSNFIMSPGPNAVTLADNYRDMFKYDHMHTD